MYLPKHFEADFDAAAKIIDEFPFASLVSTDESGSPFVNHVPLLAEFSGRSLRLIGHIARRNPQWTHFKKNGRALAIFNGPHTYITPKWYVSGRDVPTWNYAVVHITGVVKLIEDFDGLKNILQKLTTRFEMGRPNPWEFELPDDLLDPQALTGAIVGFEIIAEKIEPKFKLSQNRSVKDRTNVINELEKQKDEMSQLIRKLMLAKKSVSGGA